MKIENLDQLAELMIEQGRNQLDWAEQSRIEAQQSRIEAQQSRREAQQSRREDRELADARHAFVVAELAEIKRYTISIAGKILTDFEGGSDSQMALIQEHADKVTPLLDEESLMEGERQVVVQTPQGQKVKIVKSAPRTRCVSAIAKSYDPTLTRGELSSIGNWTSALITKAWNLQFGGRYPAILHDFIDALVGYYVCERKSLRKY